MSHLIAPSVLSANFLTLGAEIEMVDSSQADYIHLDVMDGVFVPNITFGFPIIRQISSVATLPLDAHLMIINPDPYIKEFGECGVRNLTVHYETCNHLHRTIKGIHEEGMTAGVCVNPHTPVSLLEDILEEVDIVLIMSVNPGFGGQSFISHSLDKVKKLRKMISERGLSVKIEVDGGVNLQTGKALFDAGADILVAGNFVFGAQNPLAAIEQLKKL